jgi:signal transduction histidine kinase
VFSPGGLISGLQARLIVAFVGIVLVALLVAAVVFVIIRREEQEKQALDHAIVASPAIYSEFVYRQRAGFPESVLANFANSAADLYDVRVLLIDRSNASIVRDSNGELDGQEVVFPEDFDVQQEGRFRPYVSWHPDNDAPGADLVFVSALPSRFDEVRTAPPRGAEPYWLFLAVPESTIRDAWRDLLPGLIIAALIALPIAVALGIFIAGYITHPLHKLTVASQRMAEGNYDVDVALDRRDEVGGLSRAFSTMAQRVGDAQSQMRALVANVSHDLKTPLTSILGFSQALRDGRAADEADARHMGEVIHDEASRLSRRLNDLLFLSEIESGQALLQRDEVDVQPLVRGVIERIEPQLEGRGIALEADLDDGIIVSADGEKLERALENLLDNARKYTPSAGRIGVRATAEDGATVIEVANTAGDLSEEELPRLFERFYRRGGGAGQNAADGSGLGLPIARDLIELHGGTLGAALRDGELVFTIRLPGPAR